MLRVLSRAAVKFGNKIWGNHTVMTYLKTGVFDYWVPVGRPVHWEVSAALSGFACFTGHRVSACACHPVDGPAQLHHV